MMCLNLTHFLVRVRVWDIQISRRLLSLASRASVLRRGTYNQVPSCATSLAHPRISRLRNEQRVATQLRELFLALAGYTTC
jgi:hypothetical protein